MCWHASLISTRDRLRHFGRGHKIFNFVHLLNCDKADVSLLYQPGRFLSNCDERQHTDKNIVLDKSIHRTSVLQRVVGKINGSES